MSQTYDRKALLFGDANIDVTVENTNWIDIRPSNVIDRNTEVVEFNVPKNYGSFFDLGRSYMEVEARVVNANYVGIDDTEPVGVINNLGHTMFRTLECTINQHQFRTNPGMYGMRCYLENLLGFDSDAQASYLQGAMWYPDTAEAFSETDPLGGTNDGLKDRFFLTQGSKTFKLASSIHHDLFMQERWFLSGVEIGLRFYKALDEFTIMNGNVLFSPRLELKSANLRMCQVRLADPALQSIERSIGQNNVKYPFYETNMNKFIVPEGSRSAIFDNIFPNSKLPEVMVVGLVKAARLTGEYEHSPLEFHHEGVTSVGVYVNDVATPSRPIVNNYRRLELMDGFMSLFTQFNTFGTNRAPRIPYKDYTRGYTLYAFNLSASASSNTDNCVPQPRQGVVKLEISFGAETDDNLNVIVMSKTPKTLEIDKTRQLFVK